MPRRRKQSRVPHEPGNLSKRIKGKMQDNPHFTDLIASITAYAINHTLSPSDLIDAAMASIHHLELFSYRVMQKRESDDDETTEE